MEKCLRFRPCWKQDAQYLVAAVVGIALVLDSESFAAQPAASDRQKEFARIPPRVVQIIKSERLAKQAWDPAISPNESMLTFAKLDAAEEEGSVARAQQVARPAQSPQRRGDGGAMSYDSQIWVMKLDGTDRKKLTSGPGSRSKPVFGPNGESILFVQAPGDLWVVKIDGSDLRKLPAEQPCFGQPAWSPDGRVVALAVKGKGICWLDVAGKTQTLLAVPEIGKNTCPTRLTWSPDSRLMFYEFAGAIWRVEILDGRFEKIALADAYALSPRGNLLALCRTESGRTWLELLDLEARKAIKAYEWERNAGPPRTLAWSADGGKLLCGRILIDVPGSLQGTKHSLSVSLRFPSFLSGAAFLLQDGQIVTSGTESLEARVPSLIESLRRSELSLWRLDWNSTFVSRDRVATAIPSAAIEVARAVSPRHANLLTRETDGVPAVTRLVCTEIEDRLYSAVRALAVTKYREELRSLVSDTGRLGYPDPLADGAEWGFLRRLKGLDPLRGDFIRIRDEIGRVGPEDPSRIWGYPVVTRQGGICYDSSAQGVSLLFEISGSGKVQDDIRRVLLSELRSFFALQCLHDAEAVYSFSLEKSFALVREELARLAEQNRDRLRKLAEKYTLDERGWVKHRGGIANAGFRHGKLSPSVKQKWIQKPGGSANGASPVVDDEYVYLCQTYSVSQAALHVFDRKTGESVAKLSLPSRIGVTPLVCKDHVFVVTETNELTAFEKDTWRTLWKTYLSGGHCETPLTLANGILVVTNRWGFLYGIAPDNGDVLWKHPVFDATDVILGPNYILLHTHRTPAWHIVARRLTDGEELWRTELAEGFECGYRNAFAADDTRVFAFAYKEREGRLLAFDPARGAKLWQATVGGPMSTAVACNGANLFVEGQSGQLIALDSVTGKEAWRVTIPGGRNTCPPIVIGGYVVGFNGADLYVVDIEARKTTDVIRMPNPAGTFSYLAYYDGTVYVVNGDDGWIVAME